MSKHYKIGYTTGVYDMFHIGHLNLLKNAKEYCDFLIVGVSTDEVVKVNKNKIPIIPYTERAQIVEAIKYTDKVIPQESYSIECKIKAIIDNNVEVIFVGSDWKGSDKWNKLEEELKKFNVDVIYLPHTDGISSTMLRQKLNQEKN